MNKTVRIDAQQRGIPFARYAIALGRCGGDPLAASEFAKHAWPGSPSIARALHTNATVAGATLGSLGWASELVQTEIAADYIQAVRAATVIDRLATRRAPVPDGHGARRIALEARLAEVEAKGANLRRVA